MNERCFNLSLTGRTFAQIANEVGLTEVEVEQAISEHMATITLPQVDEIRKQQDAAYNRMILFLERDMRSDDPNVRIKAIAAKNSLMVSQRQLYGLNRTVDSGILTAVRGELTELKVAPSSLAYVLAITLARQVDEEGGTAAARELRMVMQDIRDGAPVKEDSITDRLRQQREIRLARVQ